MNVEAASGAVEREVFELALPSPPSPSAAPAEASTRGRPADRIGRARPRSPRRRDRRPWPPVGDRVDGVLEDLALAACHAGRPGHLDDSLTTVECSLIDDHAQEGVTLPGLMPTPTVRLTPRESEVLRLASEGYTIRQIAERLYMGQKTVQSHLRNAINKMRGDPPGSGGAGVRRAAKDAAVPRIGVSLRRRAQRLGFDGRLPDRRLAVRRREAVPPSGPGALSCERDASVWEAEEVPIRG